MTIAIEEHVSATDLELLRAYEPIVRYNHGELFYPTNVDGYLRECDLLVGSSERGCDDRDRLPRARTHAAVAASVCSAVATRHADRPSRVSPNMSRSRS